MNSSTQHKYCIHAYGLQNKAYVNIHKLFVNIHDMFIINFSKYFVKYYTTTVYFQH